MAIDSQLSIAKKKRINVYLQSAVNSDLDVFSLFTDSSEFFILMLKASNTRCFFVFLFFFHL